MGTLRTPEGSKRYKAYIKKGGLEGGCRICEEVAIKDLQYWKIIRNSFPYDKIAKTHDMIVPKRHVTERELSRDELVELQIAKTSYIDATYEYLIESAHSQKSIPGHFHLHLIIAKE